MGTLIGFTKANVDTSRHGQFEIISHSSFKIMRNVNNIKGVYELIKKICFGTYANIAYFESNDVYDENYRYELLDKNLSYSYILLRDNIDSIHNTLTINILSEFFQPFERMKQFLDDNIKEYEHLILIPGNMKFIC